MKVGLDTSVVVRLLIGEPAPQAETARRLLLDRTPSDVVAISDVVAGEIYLALRHHYRVPHPRAVEAMRALLMDPKIEVSPAVRAVFAAEPGQDRPGFIDRLIHAGYRSEGIEFVTFDREASRLEGARLLEGT